MKQVIIVKTGEGYTDSEYTFEKEADAIEFFKSIGKAQKLTKEYISGGVGYVYTNSSETTKASLTYANFYSSEEMKVIKDKEEADRLFEIAKKEAEEAAKEVADVAVTGSIDDLAIN